MSFIFSTSLSGLRSSSNSLDVTGNHIANSNTTAYKSEEITFADVFLSSLGTNGANMPLQIGNGVATAAISRDNAQGNLAPSTSSTNMAIQGNGYFVVKDLTGAQSYTRAGDFVLDKDGFLVTSAGDRVQGYQALNGAIPANAQIGAIQVPLGTTIKPQVTANATLTMNLNSSDPTGTKFTATVQVYDSLGVSHALDLVYTKTGNLAYSVAR